MNKEVSERIQMIKQGKIPKGYFKEKDYIIPEKWKVEKSGDVISYKNGLNYSSNSTGKLTKIVGVGDFKDRFYLDLTKLGKIMCEDLDEDYYIVNGDMIFVRSNGNKELIGRVLYCEAIEEKVTFSGFTIRGRVISKEFIPKFCAYYFSSTLVKKQYMKMGGGTNISNLSQTILGDVNIFKPTLDEQKRIIKILSTCDKVINLKKEILYNKYQQKQGISQRLLSGNLRLSGYADNWKTVLLNEVLTFPKKKPVEHPERYKLLTVKLYAKGVEATDNIPNTTKNGRPYYLREPNEILIGRQNFHNGGIGIVPKEIQGYVASNAISSLITKHGDLMFYFYYLSNTGFYRRIDNLVGGTGQKEISEQTISKLKMTIPMNIEEQRAISRVIYCIDKEIELLQQEIEALKEQKRGLMQLLLTGIVRVKVD